MIDPNTGNDHLDRMLVWFRLLQQMAKTYDHRDSDVRSSLGDAVLNMGIVTNGYSIVEGDYCLSACCALGTAACHPWFNGRGLRPAFAHGGAGMKLDSLYVRLGKTEELYRSPAIAAFFGISKDLHVRIVDPEFYDTVKITPDHVLSRIGDAIRETFAVDPLSHPYIVRFQS